MTIQRHRMAKFRQFANNISTYESHEDMAKAAYELIIPDPFIREAAVLFDGDVLVFLF